MSVIKSIYSSISTLKFPTDFTFAQPSHKLRCPLGRCQMLQYDARNGLLLLLETQRVTVLLCLTAPVGEISEQRQSRKAWSARSRGSMGCRLL